LGRLKIKFLIFQIVLLVRVELLFCFRLKIFIILVPFDEEEKEKEVWFLDHEYLEIMHTMFRKVNGKQKEQVFIFD
jgi:hypothetical protein